MNVDTYLQQLEQGQLESSGRFSVDVQKAREKLAHFQLQTAGLRLLKLIQGFVMLGGTRLWITSDSSRLVLFLESATSRLDHHRLQEALVSAELIAEYCPEKHFSIGISAFLAEAHPSVFWVDFDAGGEATVDRLFGEDAMARPMFGKNLPKAGAACLLLQGIQLSQGLEGLGAYALISKRCAFAPFPIFVNGRLAQSRYWNIPKQQWRGGSIYVDGYFCEDEPEELLAMSVPGPRLTLIGPGPDLPHVQEVHEIQEVQDVPGVTVTVPYRYVEAASPPTKVAMRSPHHTGVLLQLFKGIESDFDTLLMTLQIGLGEPGDQSWVWPVQAGVTLEPMPLRLPVSGALIVVTAPDLGTDLSQFKALEDERWTRLEERLRGPLSRLLEIACRQKGELTAGLATEYFGCKTWCGLVAMLSLPRLLCSLTDLSFDQGFGLAVLLAILPAIGFKLDNKARQERFRIESGSAWQRALEALQA